MARKENDVTDRELSISRLFNAPIELVWNVWTDPAHIKNWWGPNGFTNTIHQMDLKPGGKWSLTMHGPDGTDFENESTFTEIVFQKKIAYRHESQPHFTGTIEFEAQGKKTFIKWRMVLDSKEALIELIKAHKADEGLKQNIEKLALYLSYRVN